MGLFKKLFLRVKAMDKRLKFIFVGGLNTVIGYGVNALMLLLVFQVPLSAKAQASDIAIAVSSTSGHILGMINGFFWNKYFTFENKTKSLNQFFKFALVSVMQLLLSMIIQKMLQNIGCGIYVALALTLVLTTVFSYVGHNYFTFKKNNKTNKDN